MPNEPQGVSRDEPSGVSRDEPRARRGGAGDRSALIANLFTAVAGLVGLVQALRDDPLWPLWLLAASVAIAGLVAYRLRQRRWRAAAASLTVLLLLGGGTGLLALYGRDDPPDRAVSGDGSPSAVPAATSPTPGDPTPSSPTPSSPAPSSPAPSTGAPVSTVFSDVVQLDKRTGVDLDGGRAEIKYAQDAVVDLYLDWGYMLYGSARHSTLYDDSNAGPEQGAQERCRVYREAARESQVNTYIGGGNQQYCFTTSEGNPGWLQAINTVGDGGLIVKVTVWAR